MTEKRSNPARRAYFESALSDVQQRLEARLGANRRAELECLAAKITRMRLAQNMAALEAERGRA